MECNKDEALRAKGIAEKKLQERDVTGAKKFALKAQSLFPKLDGLSQFLEIIDVYIAHEQKINGEADYYRILGVDPYADKEVLKKQYKRMALSLHPDKNKSVGADGAFKILSQAWSVLSNKDKRSEYNLKLNIRSSNQSGIFSSASVRYAAAATKPQQVPTCQRTPGTAASQWDTSVPHHPNRATSGTSSRTIPCHWQTSMVGSQYKSDPFQTGKPTPGTGTKHTAAADSHGDPAPHQPLNRAPGTNSMHIPNNHKTQATSLGSEFIPIPPHPRNPAPLTCDRYNPSGNPHIIPQYQKTPAQATAAKYIPVPQPAFHQEYVPPRNEPTSRSHPSRPETFWTSCNRCRIQFEYHKIYVNQNLLSPCCKQPFLATEIPTPNINNRSLRLWPFLHEQDGVSTASRGSRRVPASASRTHQADSRQPSSEHLKRRNEEALNMAEDTEGLTKNTNFSPEKGKAASAPIAACGGLNREKPIKKRRGDGQKSYSAKETTQGPAGSRSGLKRASENINENFGDEKPSKRAKELSQKEIHGMLMAKAKMEIIGWLNELNIEKSKSRVETKGPANALKNDSINYLRTRSSDGSLSDPKKTLQPQKAPTLKESDDADGNLDETVSMVVPDANFHNFDEDRVESSFNENQVWAAYDDDDGMPRYYALVHHIMSRQPFKLQISWLNSKSTSEFGSLDWIGSGFTKTTGDFRVGKVVVNKRLNSFSHPVKWKKGARGAIQIFPTKGDVWALYRNWSADWNADTSDEMIHEYDVVVVLEDYSDDMGVMVAPLVKVSGFTSVFNQVLDQGGILTIPRQEMFRFSHQVPFYMLNRCEAENASCDCYELDPAALPLELLKVITNAKAAEGRVSEQPVMLGGLEVESAGTNSRNTHTTEERRVEVAKCILTYSRRNKGRKMDGNVYQPKR